MEHGQSRCPLCTVSEVKGESDAKRVKPTFQSWPSTLQLKDSQQSLLAIVVKSLDSHKHALNISPDMTIKRFKQWMGEMEAVDWEQTRLILKGQPLLDDKTLLESQVKSGDIIHVVWQMRGS